MLKSTRLLMLLLISFTYYAHIPDGRIDMKILTGIGIFLYSINHFGIMLGRLGRKWVLLLLGVDMGVTGMLGYIFAPSTLYLILFGVLGLSLFLYTEHKRTLFSFSAAFFVVWAIILIHTYQSAGQVEVVENTISFMFVFFQSLVGNLIRKLLQARQTVDLQYEHLNESHQSLQEAHVQLRTYAKEVEELTAIRERNHIAREIHDTVGHNMTALLVQIQLAQELLKRSPEHAEQTLQTCYELARNSLQEVRLSVRTLKEEGHSSNLAAVIRTLLSDFSKTAHMEAEFQLQGDPSLVPTSLHPTIARIVQESMTNTKKHGGASLCRITLSCQEERVGVMIEDNGQGSGEIQPGFGLLNMKERAEEHGGSIVFTSREGDGFRVQAEFPLQQRKWVIGGTAG
ncbi:sensor histidine kinase [Ectobacillus ponti]|uniref:histidine kinase n=1 Tax=Ectobacillus ponti TaxID=2961894 RepID=A0AA41X9G7_9BACI|nr:sensor histidine kinase [Ectobacillus ponti]MCP8971267.1 sensor histidine kinase [Ectobacillus ponti]